MEINLERELCDNQKIKDKCRADLQYAKNLYAALCNTIWFKDENSVNTWSTTWRAAGGIVAFLRAQNEDYLHFYCTGKEGTVHKEIAEDLMEMGWGWK